MAKKIRLGVNIDHCATLRQVRGSENPYPDLHEISRICKQAGADQITIHLREDRRHIQDRDVQELCDRRILPINLEMAVDLKMLAVALKYRPDWVCFVPEKRQELTTEGGLDVVAKLKPLKNMISELKKAGIKSSTFIEATKTQVQASYAAGAEAVEFHTGKWVLLSRSKPQPAKQEWNKLEEAAELAHKLGLKVHAGHGLDLETTREISQLSYLRELNIGHFIVCDSLIHGLKGSVKRIKKCLNSKK